MFFQFIFYYSVHFSFRFPLRFPAVLQFNLHKAVHISISSHVRKLPQVTSCGSGEESTPEVPELQWRTLDTPTHTNSWQTWRRHRRWLSTSRKANCGSWVCLSECEWECVCLASCLFITLVVTYFFSVYHRRWLSTQGKANCGLWVCLSECECECVCLASCLFIAVHWW